jgi:outer membrane protein TolC
MYHHITGYILVLTAVICLPGNAQSITLQQAISAALKTHPAGSSAKADYKLATGNKLTALAPDPASLAVEYAGIPRGESINGYEERKLSLSQEFKFPLKYYWLNKVEGIVLSEAKIEAISQMLDLELEVSQVYIEAWSIGQELKILEENSAAANQYAQQLTRMVELGESSRLEERRVKVEALKVSIELNAARKSHTAILGKLARITGIETAHKTLQQPPNLDAVNNLQQSSSINPEGSLKHKSAQLQNDLANFESKTAAFDWLPDMEFSYFRQLVPAESEPDYWGVELAVSLPVWFWISERGKIKSAQANKLAANARMQNTRLQLQTTADELNQTQLALREKLQLFDNQVQPQADEAYVLAMKSYQMGEASYLEVIDSQRTLLDIQLEQLEIKADLANTLAEINQLSGRSVLGLEEIQKLLRTGN